MLGTLHSCSIGWRPGGFSHSLLAVAWDCLAPFLEKGKAREVETGTACRILCHRQPAEVVLQPRHLCHPRQGWRPRWMDGMAQSCACSAGVLGESLTPEHAMVSQLGLMQWFYTEMQQLHLKYICLIYL